MRIFVIFLVLMAAFDVFAAMVSWETIPLK